MNIAVTQYRHVDEMRPWSDREHLLECVAVTPEAPDVMTFTFKPNKPGLWFRYLPGQFVTLEIPVGPEPVMRTYTLSSSPSRPYTVSVTVKAQANSIGTRWMFDSLKPGMKIRAIGPLGDFSYVAMAWVTENAGRSGVMDLDRKALGIPELDEMVERYCKATGRDGVPDMNWYFAYNFFRLAGIIQGIKKQGR